MVGGNERLHNALPSPPPNITAPHSQPAISPLLLIDSALIAQLVERGTSNAEVYGSNPYGSSCYLIITLVVLHFFDLFDICLVVDVGVVSEEGGGPWCEHYSRCAELAR